MTWARDLVRMIRTTERDAGLRSAEVLRDGGCSCHDQVDLTGDFLLHPIRGAPLLDHQFSFRWGYPFPALFCAAVTGWFGPPTGGGGGAPCAISPGAGAFPNAGIGACCLICTMLSLSLWNSRQSLSMWLAFFLPCCLSM